VNSCQKLVESDLGGGFGGRNISEGKINKNKKIEKGEGLYKKIFLGIG